MPSIHFADSVATVSAFVGLSAIIAFMVLVDKEERRKLAYAAIASGAAGTMVFAISAWYCAPVETAVEPRLAESYDLAPLNFLGYSEEHGSAIAVRIGGGIGAGAYVVAIETEDYGCAKMSIPDDATVIYRVNNAKECRLEEWIDCEIKTYRDGTSETKPLSGLGHAPTYKLYVPDGGIDEELTESNTSRNPLRVKYPLSKPNPIMNLTKGYL